MRVQSTCVVRSMSTVVRSQLWCVPTLKRMCTHVHAPLAAWLQRPICPVGLAFIYVRRLCTSMAIPTARLRALMATACRRGHGIPSDEYSREMENVCARRSRRRVCSWTCRGVVQVFMQNRLSEHVCALVCVRRSVCVFACVCVCMRA